MTYKSKHLQESLSVKAMLSFLVKNQNLLSEYDIKNAYGNVIAEKLSTLKKYGSFYLKGRDIESMSHKLSFDLNDYTYEQIVAELDKQFGGTDGEVMIIKNNYSWTKDFFYGFKPGSKTEFSVKGRMFSRGINSVLEILNYAITGKATSDLRLGSELADKYGLKTGFSSSPDAYSQKNIKELGIVIKQFKNGKVLVGGLKSDAIERLKRMSQVLIGR